MTEGPVSVLIAGPDMTGNVLRAMYPPFDTDRARFQVLSLACEWPDVAKNVQQYRPEVLVLDGALAPNPQTLRDYLAQLAGVIAVVALPNASGWAEQRGLFEGLAQVRGVYVGLANWSQIASAVYSAGATERTRLSAAAPVMGMPAAAPALGVRAAPMVVGTRTIAFTSFAGGTGKSTIAEAIAVELARNRVRTLLCSFNSPAAVVGHFGMKFSPDAMEWFNRPTTEGFQAALQKVRAFEDLDVLIAPNDPQELIKAASKNPQEPGSIQQLVYAAYAFNYGAILLDLPPVADSMWAVQPILAANMAVLVGRATLHDQFASIRAYKLFVEQLATQHRVPPEAMFAVLNFDTPDDNMSEADYQAGISQITGRFPPILATFPYVSKLPAVQNRGESPVLAPECDHFARAARSLTGKLVGGTPAAAGRNGSAQADGGGLLGKLGLRVKVR